MTGHSPAVIHKKRVNVINAILFLKPTSEMKANKISLKVLFSYSLIIVISVSLLACGGKNNDVNLRMTHTENKKIEALYTSRLDSLRPLWDSLCVMNHDKMVSHALDSIIKERLEEEALLRNRITQ